MAIPTPELPQEAEAAAGSCFSTNIVISQMKKTITRSKFIILWISTPMAGMFVWSSYRKKLSFLVHGYFESVFLMP